jgi:hypothetical protein
VSTGDPRESIPRMSHDCPRKAAYEGSRLQVMTTFSEPSQGAELVFVLVAGVGFEPT